MECFNKGPTTRSRTNSMVGMPKANDKFPMYKEHEDITARSREDANAFMKEQ